MKELAPDTPRSRLHLLALAGALLAGAGARLYVAAHAETLARDGTVYLLMAREFQSAPAGEVARSFAYHPGYSAVVSVLASWLHPAWPDGWIALARGVSIVAGLVALAALYAIARSVFDRRVALLTVWLAALAETFTEISADVVSDAPAVAMTLVAIALALAARRALSAGRPRGLLWAVASGLVGGAGYLFRPEELLAAVVSAGIVLWPGGARAGTRRLRLAAAGGLVAATLLCAIPYAAAVGGLTQKKTLGDFVSAGGSTLLADSTLSEEAIGAVRRAFDRGRQAMGLVVAPLAAVFWVTWLLKGIFRVPFPRGLLIRPRPAGLWAMFAPLAFLAPLLVAMEVRLGPGYLSSRHLLMPALLLAPCAGAGLMILVQDTLLLTGWLGWARRERAFVLLWTGAMVAVSVFRALPALHEGKGGYRAAGEAIAARLGPGQRVLSPNGWAPFFAGAPADGVMRLSPHPFELRAEDLASPDALWRRMGGEGVLTYPAVAVNAGALDDAPDPRLLDALRRDARFTVLGPYGPAGKHAVWVILAAPQAGTAPFRQSL